MVFFGSISHNMCDALRLSLTSHFISAEHTLMYQIIAITLFSVLESKLLRFVYSLFSRMYGRYFCCCCCCSPRSFMIESAYKKTESPNSFALILTRQRLHNKCVCLFYAWILQLYIYNFICDVTM